MNNIFRDFSKSSMEQWGNILEPIEDRLQRFQKHCMNADPVTDSSNFMESEQTWNILSTDMQKDFRVVKVKADGDCFYSSISMSIFGSEKFKDELRLLTVYHLLKMRDTLEPNSESFFGAGMTYAKILKRASLNRLTGYGDAGWAEEPHIYVLSGLIGRPIVNHQYHKRLPMTWAFDFHRQEKQISEYSRPPVYMILKGGHFEPMIPTVEHPSSIENCNHTFPWLYNGYDNVRVSKIDECEEDNSRKMEEDEESSIPIVEEQVARSVDLGTKPKGQLKLTEIISAQSNCSSTVKTEPVRMDIDDNEPVLPGSKSLGNFAEEHVPIDENLCVQELEDFKKQEFADIPKVKHFQGALDQINKKLDNLTLLLQNQNAPPKTGVFPSVSTKQSQMKEQNAAEPFSSIEEILNHYPFLEPLLDANDAVGDDVFTEIVCTPCIEANPADGRSAGRFRYHSTSGVDFSDMVQTSQFRNLKGAIKKHVEGASHLKIMQETIQDLEISVKKNREAGLVCGRYAYFAVKMDHNVARYEDYVANASCTNATVGDINHGRHFARNFAHATYTVLHKQFIRQLNKPLTSTGRPAPFTVIADKYTPDRRAGQIVGIVCFDGQKMNAFNIDFARVKEYHGEGIAKMLFTSLRTIQDRSSIVKRLLGGCFDGEYFNKKVDKILMTNASKHGNEMELMNLSNDQMDWYSFDWDKAHILERANLNAMTKSKAFADVEKAVHQITKEFRVGKSFTEAEDDAELHSVRFYSPLQSSDTRFARHQHQVLENFQKNYECYYRALNASRDNSLAKIDNTSFILGLCTEIDIMNRVAELSEKLQTVGLNSWRMYDAISQTFHDLEEMCNSLSNADNFHPRMTMLKDATSSLSENSTYKGIPILASTYAINRTRKAATASEVDEISSHLSVLQKKCTNYVKVLKSAFEARSDPNIAKVYPLMETSFRLENVVKHADSQHVPPEFLRYFSLAKNVGYLPDDLDDASIKNQYLNFCCSVKAQYVKKTSFETAASFEKLEMDIFNNILSSNIRTNHSDVTHLLLSALSRAHCEGVCESMGSVIKDVVDDRSIKFENIQEEMFIAYNGPKPWDECTTKLIEESLNEYFGDKPWHFVRKTKRRSLLETYGVSQVVDRKKKEAKEQTKIKCDDMDFGKRQKT